MSDKFNLDLRSILDGVDDLIKSVRESANFSNQVIVMANTLDTEMRKFRNEHNFVKYESDDSDFGDGDHITDTSSSVNDYTSDDIYQIGYVPSSSSDGSTSSSNSMAYMKNVNVRNNSVSSNENNLLLVDAKNVIRTAIKKDDMIDRSGTSKMLLPSQIASFLNLNTNRHIWCLKRINIPDSPFYVFYIFKTKKDKQPLHCFFLKDIKIRIESDRMLIVEHFIGDKKMTELKYEAESGEHANAWIHLIAKNRSYEPLKSIIQNEPQSTSCTSQVQVETAKAIPAETKMQAEIAKKISVESEKPTTVVKKNEEKKDNTPRGVYLDTDVINKWRPQTAPQVPEKPKTIFRNTDLIPPTRPLPDLPTSGKGSIESQNTKLSEAANRPAIAAKPSQIKQQQERLIKEIQNKINNNKPDSVSVSSISSLDSKTDKTEINASKIESKIETPKQDEPLVNDTPLNSKNDLYVNSMPEEHYDDIVEQTEIQTETKSEINASNNIVGNEDELSDQEDYQNRGLINVITSNYGQLYLSLYDTNALSNLTKDALKLKRGDVIQCIEKVSDDYFIAKLFKNSVTNPIGLVSYKYVTKIYSKGLLKK